MRSEAVPRWRCLHALDGLRHRRLASRARTIWPMPPSPPSSPSPPGP